MSTTANEPTSSIQVQLIKPVLGELAKDGLQTAKAISRSTVSNAQLLDFMVGDGGGISKPQAKAFYEAYAGTVSRLLLAGHNIPVGDLGYLHVTAKGVFDAEGKPVEGKELIFKINFLPKKSLKKLLADLPYTTIEAHDRQPRLNTVTDSITLNVNSVVTRGMSAKLNGKNLKFHPLVADEGLFFVPVEGGAAVKVTQFLDNRDVRLTFNVPAELTEGTDYRLEARKRFNGCKTLRIGTLENTLSVN